MTDSTLPSSHQRSQRAKFHAVIAALILPALCALFAISCATVSRDVLVPREIPGATYVGNNACYYCHTNYSHTFPASPHARVRFKTPNKIADVGCESCHGPGSKHAEVGGRRFIINPGRDPAACFECHIETHAEFEMPHHHPVIEGKMNCVQCHDPHGFDIMKPAGGLAMARQNENCSQCHREQTRPFVFEHEAMREGCTVCHSPHGSINARMLVERDNNLCLKCHAQRQGTFAPNSIFIGAVDHTDELRMGTCWSAGCHTAVHGSNFNPRQLY